MNFRFAVLRRRLSGAGCLLLLDICLWQVPVACAEKDHSVTVTAEMRANAQANIGKYPWAAKQRDAAVKGARHWLEMDDAELWSLVTPQSLPRTIHTTLIRGTNRVAWCPKCREGIVPFGNYPWHIDALKRPWKLQCPNCSEIFPKNDFWAYYRSALDEHGKFQPGKGDAQLLFNAEHPDPNDPLHKYGVDDGYTGRLLLWEPGGKAQVIEAESPGIFAGTTTYRRLTALVDVSAHAGYAVDFFRVRGGRTHRQSWHGPAAEAVAPELHLVSQAEGAFAGEATAFGQLPEKWAGNPGYMYLYDVRRDGKPPSVFTLDYRAEDRRQRIAPGKEPRLRLTCLTPCDEVALAHGDPPQNKSGSPRRLQYAILSRT